MLEFELPYLPSVNRYWRMVHGRVLNSRAGVNSVGRFVQS